MIHLILGGARSGKSRYAEELAAEFEQVTYVATAQAFDEAMAHRIKRHQASRPAHWQTLEQWQDFQQPFKSPCVLVDCVTLLISNHLLAAGDIDELSPEEIDRVEQTIMTTLEDLLRMAQSASLILVSNEVGLGLAPPYPLGNVFRDIAGRINQMLARRADRVVFMTAGLPLVLKAEQ